MIKKEFIGTEHYSKILDKNVSIVEGPSDDYYKIIGLEIVLEGQKEKVKMTFPKVEKDDSNK